jgi:predicted Zn finger-like uncharacterized protein
MDVTTSQTVINCPHCGHASTYHVSLHDLAQGKKVLCEKCGREIVVDRAKLEKAERILANLNIQDDEDGTKTFDADGAHVSVLTKTFAADDASVDDPADLGRIIREKVKEAEAGGQDAPRIAAPPRIEPKRGCLGVLAIVVLLGAAVVFGSLFG